MKPDFGYLTAAFFLTYLILIAYDAWLEFQLARRAPQAEDRSKG